MSLDALSEASNDERRHHTDARRCETLVELVFIQLRSSILEEKHVTFFETDPKKGGSMEE